MALTESQAPERWQIFGATAFAVGVASTATQLAVAAALGELDSFDWRFSSGGLLAIVAGFVLQTKATTWTAWRRQVGWWLAAAALLAGASTAAVVPQLEDEPGSVGITSGVPNAPVTRAAVAERVKDFVTASNRDEWLDVFDDAYDRDWTESQILSAIESDTIEDMPPEQRCVLKEWIPLSKFGDKSLDSSKLKKWKTQGEGDESELSGSRLRRWTGPSLTDTATIKTCTDEVFEELQGE